MFSHTSNDERCLGCAQPFTNPAFLFFKRKDALCVHCRQRLDGLARRADIQGMQVHYFYVYEEDFAKYLYHVKGLKDIRYASLFLTPYKAWLQKNFKGALFLHMPSWYEDDAARGFNHVKEIFAGSNTIHCPFRKVKNDKQSGKSKECRQEVQAVIELKEALVNQQPIVLIDDVLTTGATLRHAADLLHIPRPNIVVCAIHKLNMSKKGERKKLL